MIPNADASQFRSFYFNDAHRARWDKNYTQLFYLPCRTLEEFKETAVFYARCDVLVSSREYIYARRVWGRADGGCYAVYKTCPDVQVPPRRGTSRVQEYISTVLIRALPNNTVELTVTYYESKPPPAPEFVVKKAMRRLTSNTVKAFRAFQKAADLQPAASEALLQADPSLQLAQEQQRLSTMLEGAVATLRSLRFQEAGQQALAAVVLIPKLAASHIAQALQIGTTLTYRMACDLAQTLRVAWSCGTSLLTHVMMWLYDVEWNLATRISRHPVASPLLLGFYNACSLLAHAARRGVSRLAAGRQGPMSTAAAAAAVQQALRAHSYDTAASHGQQDQPSLVGSGTNDAASRLQQHLNVRAGPGGLGSSTRAFDSSTESVESYALHASPLHSMHTPASCSQQSATTPLHHRHRLPRVFGDTMDDEEGPMDDDEASSSVWAAAESGAAGASPSMACSDGVSPRYISPRPGGLRSNSLLHRLNQVRGHCSPEPSGPQASHPINSWRALGDEVDLGGGAGLEASSCAATFLSSHAVHRGSLDSTRELLTAGRSAWPDDGSVLHQESSSPDPAAKPPRGPNVGHSRSTPSAAAAAPAVLAASAEGQRPFRPDTSSRHRSLPRPHSCPMLAEGGVGCAPKLSSLPFAQGSVGSVQQAARPLAAASTPPTGSAVASSRAAVPAPLPEGRPRALQQPEHEASVVTEEQCQALSTYVQVSSQLFAMHTAELTRQRLYAFLAASADVAAAAKAAHASGAEGHSHPSSSTTTSARAAGRNATAAGDGNSHTGASQVAVSPRHSARSQTRNGWQRWDYSRNYTSSSQLSSATPHGHEISSHKRRGGSRQAPSSSLQSNPPKFVFRLVRAAGARVARGLFNRVGRKGEQDQEAAASRS